MFQSNVWATMKMCIRDSVNTTFQANVPQYIVEIDYAKALAQNIDLQELYTTLSSMLGTYYVNDFNKYGRVFKVQIQAESRFRDKASDLSGIYVKNNNGVMAVSYTHLDVYKRQLLGCSIPAWPRTVFPFGIGVFKSTPTSIIPALSSVI